MAKHADADSSHGDSRTYGGNKNQAGRNAMEPKLVREGKVQPDSTPKK